MVHIRVEQKIRSYNPTPKVIKPVVISSAASVTTAVITTSIKAVIKVVAFAAVRIWICIEVNIIKAKGCGCDELVRKDIILKEISAIEQSNGMGWCRCTVNLCTRRMTWIRVCVYNAGGTESACIICISMFYKKRHYIIHPTNRQR